MIQRADEYSAICASGGTPPDGMFRAIYAAARYFDMRDEPAVLTAATFQAWLHPRGKDGRFIDRLSFVNIFANALDSVASHTAYRRRAQIKELRPDGAHLVYFDRYGNQIPANPVKGFPGIIPVDEIGSKVALAPKHIAYLKPTSSSMGTYVPKAKTALTYAAYQDQVTALNDLLRSKAPEQDNMIASGQGPISAADFTRHADYIARATSTGLSGSPGLAYDAAFKDDHGLYSDEQQAKLDDLVAELRAELVEGKPKGKRAIMLGGLPGAGKGSVLSQMMTNGVINTNDWITVNPDILKDRMMEKGMFPQVYGLTPAETAGFTHATSAELAIMLENSLTTDGYNVIFDITMGGRSKNLKYETTLKTLQGLGYTTDGIFVDVTPKTALSRTRMRHLAGLNAYRATEPNKGTTTDERFGGRFVPPSAVMVNAFRPTDARPGDTRTYSSINSRNFSDALSYFTRWAFYSNDTDGKPPTYIGGSAINPEDRTNMPGYITIGSDVLHAPVSTGAPAGVT